MARRWILAALIAVATPAFAHDWYPMECCHAMDCAPVDKVEIVPSPAMANFMGTPAVAATSPSSMLVTTKHGSVLVPANFPRRESKDNRMHACMRPAAGGGGMRLICLFMPPSM